MLQALEPRRALVWLLLVAPLSATTACRRNGRPPAADTPVGPTTAAAEAGPTGPTADGATTAAVDAAPDAPPPPADGAPVVELPPFVPDPEPVVPPELPLRLNAREGWLEYSSSVLAAGGGGSVIVATSSGNHAGYVFERLEPGWVETFRFELAVLASHGSGREQVAVSGDGDTIAVALLESHDCPGGSCPAQGTLGCWERRPGGWARSPNLPAPEELAFKGLGLALAIDAAGDTIVVSIRDEPGTYVYQRADGGWTGPVPLEGTAPFGRAVDLAIDGDRIAVGAPGGEAPATGVVVLFERREGTWVEAGRIAAPREADPTFGSAVALAGDLLVVGGYGEVTERGGAAFVFERVDGEWRQTARLRPRDGTEHMMYGRAATFLGGGRLIAVQSLYTAHLFARDTGDWQAGEALGGEDVRAQVRELAAAGPAVALLGVGGIRLQAVPGLEPADVPPVPLRPTPTPPDCRRARACLQACAADADCCPQPPCGEGMWSSVCRDARCRLTGCTADAECTAPPGARCFPDATGLAVHGLCALPCTTDADCQPPYVCLAGRSCGLRSDNPWRCFSDLDCARRNGLEHCDVAGGCCECGDDAYCEGPMHGGPGTRCLPR